MEGGLKMTELRLGLPGGGAQGAGAGSVGGSGREVAKNSNKRGFYETGDLKLNFSSSSASSKEIFTGSNSNEEKFKNELKKKERSSSSCSNDPAKPPAKAQVVGWPPVQSFRRNIISTKKSSNNNNSKDEEEEGHEKTSSNAAAAAASFVKVSMDGAPYLRKVDLKMYKSYKELYDALANMFSSFTIGTCGSQGMKDFMNESKLMDLLNGSDYVPTYEDKDGDWMLVGDVPWEMFVESCKRLRIMKGKEAIGLAPRAMEKCKNRS